VTEKSTTVLHVCSSLATGGLERVVLELARSAPTVGLRAQVAVMSGGGALQAAVEAAGARVHVLGKAPGLRPELVWRLAAVARATGAAILHAHNQGPMLYAGLAGLILGRPVIGTRHGQSRADQTWGPQRRYRALSRLVGRLCRYTVCVGADALALAATVDRLPRERLRLIHNGVDADLLRPDAVVRARVRAELGLTPDDFVIVAVGRLAREKDLPTALAAFELVEAPHARLLLVGEGDQRPALEELIRARGLAGRARLVGERRDVPAVLAAADAFVNSSRSEGLSMAILEAMSVGLPVAATAVGGTVELVADGVNGFLAPAGQAAALGRALAALAADPALAARLGARGRRIVLERFSLAAMAQAYAGLYAEALA